MTDENPLVSIIVITYNSAKYVLETLESAKDQTYKNIELIVTDDFSTDNTVEICREWLENNSTRFVRNELITVEKNTGIPANCNRGVKASKGEWIKLIAGDDVLFDTCVSDYIQYVSQKEIHIAFSYSNRYQDIFADNNFICKYPSQQPFLYTSEKISAEEQYKSLLMGNSINAPTIFIRNEIISLVGSYDERIPLMEDYPLWLKITKAGYKVHFMPKITVKHRFHQNATDSYISNYIHKPAYFRNDFFRKEYIYPNISKNIRLRDTYTLICRKILNKLGFNKNKWIYINIDQVFTKYLNPFAWIDYMASRL